jgi:hypothetical protein
MLTKSMAGKRFLIPVIVLYMKVAVTSSVLAELKLSFLELRHKVLMEYLDQRE